MFAVVCLRLSYCASRVMAQHARACIHRSTHPLVIHRLHISCQHMRVRHRGVGGWRPRPLRSVTSAAWTDGIPLLPEISNISSFIGDLLQVCLPWPLRNAESHSRQPPDHDVQHSKLARICAYMKLPCTLKQESYESG
jgi:hypothetical protein